MANNRSSARLGGVSFRGLVDLISPKASFIRGPDSRDIFSARNIVQKRPPHHASHRSDLNIGSAYGLGEDVFNSSEKNTNTKRSENSRKSEVNPQNMGGA